jgi:hypothetical protein
VIGPNEALRLEVIIDHTDGDVERLAGEMFQLDGPRSYHPTPFAVSTPDKERQSREERRGILGHYTPCSLASFQSINQQLYLSV